MKGHKEKPNGMGFVQVAKIEKLSTDEINNSINDEPGNNIIEIKEVESDEMQANTDEDKEMMIQPPSNNMFKRIH